MTQADRVLIVGAGPVGCVLALALRRQADVPILLVEALEAPEKDCRAASCHPPTIKMLAELGLLEVGKAQGLISPVMHYHDRVTRELVGSFDFARMQDPPEYPYVLQWEQYKIAGTILDRLASDPGAEICMNTKLVGLTQDDGGITATVACGDGETQDLRVRYLVGCDGGRSTVRKLAQIEFEGFTWPERFLKIDTRYDFSTLGPDIANRNYFSDLSPCRSCLSLRGRAMRRTRTRWRRFSSSCRGAA